MSKKIISVFLIFAISLSAFALPVHAAAEASTTVSSTGSFWQMVANSNSDFMQFLMGKLSNSALGNGTVCPESPDAKHYGSPIGAGRNSDIVLCRCKYCDETFEVDESVVEDAYQDYVDSLPPGLNAGSSGTTAYGNGVTWSTTDENAEANAFWKTIDLYDLFEDAKANDVLVVSRISYNGEKFLGFRVCLEDGLRYLLPGYATSLLPYNSLNFPLGRLCSDISNASFYTVRDGYRVFLTYEEANAYYTSTQNACFFLKPGSYFSIPFECNSYFGPTFNGVGCISSGGVVSSEKLAPGEKKWACETYSYTKSSQNGLYPLSTDVSGTDVDSGSRPGSVSGNFGTMNDDSTLNNIGNQVIVNEANNTFYNPATGQQEPMDSWTYDYATRSYNIVTGDGNTVTVTYGNENLTINNGDVTYNIYYMNDNSASQGQCTHKYTVSTLKSPTCKAAGLDQYTCDMCGHAYTTSSSATGHTWKILRDVNTSYDETGTLIQEGYTIYECEICGEQYKSTDGSAPPTVNNGSSSGSGSGSGDSSGGGIFDKLGQLLGTLGGGLIDGIGKFVGFILDSLISLAEMVRDKGLKFIDLILSFFERIPGLFGAFPAFLAAVFPFIPEDMLLILEFGLAAVVLLGLIKMWRK